MSSTREFVPLRFEYNEARDVITIEGIAYHADLFRAFGFDSIGTVLRIDSRADGVVIFSRLYEPVTRDALIDEMADTLRDARAVIQGDRKVVWRSHKEPDGSITSAAAKDLLGIYDGTLTKIEATLAKAAWLKAPQ